MTFNNKNICITGTLSKMERAKAFNLIIAEGGCPKTNMSAIVDILVVANGIERSGKISKAKMYDTLIITEQQFYETVGV